MFINISKKAWVFCKLYLKHSYKILLFVFKVQKKPIILSKASVGYGVST